MHSSNFPTSVEISWNILCLATLKTKITQPFLLLIYYLLSFYPMHRSFSKSSKLEYIFAFKYCHLAVALSPFRKNYRQVLDKKKWSKKKSMNPRTKPIRPRKKFQKKNSTRQRSHTSSRGIFFASTHIIVENVCELTIKQWVKIKTLIDWLSV